MTHVGTAAFGCPAERSSAGGCESANDRSLTYHSEDTVRKAIPTLLRRDS